MTGGFAAMSESKSFASLGPTLLARKGGARPAMRPQLQPVGQFEQSAAANPSAEDLEDLGWNDMGDDIASQLTPEPVHADALDPVRPEPEVKRQQDDLAARIAIPANDPVDTVAQTVKAAKAAKAARVAKAAKPAGKRAAFTLRLDADRHLKLRLAATLKNCSAQHIVTEALDRLLSEMPELASLARQVGKN